MSLLTMKSKILRSLKSRTLRSWVFLVMGTGLLVYVGSQYATMYFEQQRLVSEFEEQNKLALQGPAKEVTAAQALTRINIPKINLDAVVVEGTTSRQLLLGPGRIKRSAIPGERGNTVITAHRDTFFRHIYELRKGDDILLKRNGQTYKYQVQGYKIVKPTDLSVIQPTDEARLTLITCYPTYFIGPAPERLVVFSKLIEKAPPADAGTGTTAGLGAAH